MIINSEIIERFKFLGDFPLDIFFHYIYQHPEEEWLEPDESIKSFIENELYSYKGLIVENNHGIKFYNILYNFDSYEEFEVNQFTVEELKKQEKVINDFHLTDEIINHWEIFKNEIGEERFPNAGKMPTKNIILLEDEFWGNNPWIITEFFLKEVEQYIFEKYPAKTDFNKKYNLIPDKIFTLKEVSENCRLQKMNIDEDPLVYYQKKINSLQLIPKVPENVKELFDVVKKIFIYGGLEYSFFQVASERTCLLSELAIKEFYKIKFPEDIYKENGKEKKLDFACIIGKLEKKKIIKKREKIQYFFLRTLRNSSAHLKDRYLIPPEMAFSNIESVIYRINYLYDNFLD